MRTNEKHMRMGYFFANVECASQRRANCGGGSGFEKPEPAESFSAEAIGTRSANGATGLIEGAYETDEWHDLGGEG